MSGDGSDKSLICLQEVRRSFGFFKLLDARDYFRTLELIGKRAGSSPQLNEQDVGSADIEPARRVTPRSSALCCRRKFCSYPLKMMILSPWGYPILPRDL